MSCPLSRPSLPVPRLEERGIGLVDQRAGLVLSATLAGLRGELLADHHQPAPAGELAHDLRVAGRVPGGSLGRKSGEVARRRLAGDLARLEILRDRDARDRQAAGVQGQHGPVDLAVLSPEQVVDLQALRHLRELIGLEQQGA